MSDMIKDGGIGAVQAAVAASTDKAEMHKCNEYRRRFGQGVRQRVPVHMLVPHPDNRSGVFPSSTRVRELACQIIVLGFSQAEADFEGVCVRDYTADQLKERPGYMSFAQNVAEKAKGCVKELYQHGYGEALFGTLSHTHLAVILRAIAAGVKWEIPADDLTPDQLTQLEPYKEQGTGLLMMSAVADRDEVAKKADKVIKQLMTNDTKKNDTIIKVRNLPGSSYNSSGSGSNSGGGGASLSLMEKRKMARKKKSRRASSISTIKA